MSIHNLTINKTDIEFLNSFNDEFSSVAISLCPLLKKFSIYIVNHNTTDYADVAQLNENDAFAFYINKEEEDASSTYAEIIVNKDLCNTLKLTKQEIKAAVAHEIGHIITFFRTDKDKFQKQDEEYYSDSYACRMGLTIPLSFLLNKLIESGLYSESQVLLIKKRLSSIELLNYDTNSV